MNQPSSSTQERAQLALVSSDSSSIAGEPLAYPSTPDPEISSYILPIAPGAVTEWMVHPVPGYLYVIEGTLTVEFADDGSRQSFQAGQAFLQARAKWHRGRNDGVAQRRAFESGDELVARADAALYGLCAMLDEAEQLSRMLFRLTQSLRPPAST